MQQALHCERALTAAARETSVPTRILKAISRTESGRNIDGALMPWPWTINIGGQGSWFKTKSEALAHFQKNYQNGSRNIDVGCFQINHRWHGARFASVDDMMDPFKNARYAAEFLKELYGEFGNWSDATGAYHSRNKELSDIYLTRFSQILEGLDDGRPAPNQSLSLVQNTNSFPLLRGGASSSARGSLFPSDTTRRRNLLIPTDERG